MRDDAFIDPARYPPIGYGTPPLVRAEDGRIGIQTVARAVQRGLLNSIDTLPVPP
jgi:hypothetical protein